MDTLGTQLLSFVERLFSIECFFLAYNVHVVLERFVLLQSVLYHCIPQYFVSRPFCMYIGGKLDKLTDYTNSTNHEYIKTPNYYGCGHMRGSSTD